MADINKQIKIQIVGDNDKFQKSIDDTSKQARKFGDTIKKAMRVGAIATAALGAAAIKMVRDFSTQEQVLRKTEATIRATGGAAGLTTQEISKMASELQKVTKFGDEAIISGQNLLLTFRNIGKDTFPRATKVMLDMSEAMGQDMKSSAIQLGKALNDPVLGVTALQRVGITFTEQQKEQIKAMQESGNVAGAQALILKELEMQFGGVAEASAKGTGVFRQVGNLLGDISEIGGKVITEFLVPATRQFKAFLEQAIESGRVEKIFKNIASLIAPLISGFGNLFNAVEFVFDSINKLKLGFNQFFVFAASLPIKLSNIWLEFKKTSLEAVKAVVDSFNSGIQSVQEAGAKVPLFGKLVGEPTGSEGLTGISEGLGRSIDQIGLEKESNLGNIANLQATADDEAMAAAGLEEKDAADKGVDKIQAGLPATDTEFNAILEKKEEQTDSLAETEKENQAKLTDVFKKGNEERENIFNDSLDNQIKTLDDKNATEIQKTKATLGALNNLSSVFGEKGKRVAQALGLSNATISIARGIAKAQELGFPANIAEAARVAAVGASQFAAIKGAAGGTIVGGLDQGRDNRMMAVRSGEMILPPDLAVSAAPTIRDIVRNEDQIGAPQGSTGGSVKIEFVGDAGRILREIDRETNYVQGL